MPHQPKAYCKSCGRPILWCVTDNGKRMPLDEQYEARIVLDPSTDPMVGRVRRTYQSHFSTCPQAREHRKTES